MNNKILLALLGVVLLLAGCGKVNKEEKLIPENAVFVLGIHADRLFQKMAWNSISGSPIFKEMLSKGGDTLTKIDLAESGINHSSSFYFYLLPDSNQLFAIKGSIILPLSDAKQFEQFLSKHFSEYAIQSQGSLKLQQLSEDVAVAFNNETAIVSFAIPVYGNDKQNGDASSLLTNTVKAFEVNKAITANSYYKKIRSTDNDVFFYLNYELTMNQTMNKDMMSAMIMGQSKFYKDAYLGGGVNFEKGRVVVSGKYYFNDFTGAIMKQMERKDIKNPYLEKVVGQQLNLFTAYHINPQGIKVMLDEMEMTAIANSFLGQIGFTIDEVLAIFKGDALFTITDFSVEVKEGGYEDVDKQVSYKSPQPVFNTALQLSINDEQQLQKLIDYGMKEGIFQKQSENLYVIAGFIYMVASKDLIVLSDKLEYATQVAGATGQKWNNLPAEVVNKPYSLYVDIANTLDNIDASKMLSRENEDSAAFYLTKQTFESLKCYGDHAQNGSSPFEAVLQLRNKEDNSLMQLINYFSKIAEYNRGEEAAYQNQLKANEADVIMQ